MARYYVSFEMPTPNEWPDWVLYAYKEKPVGATIVAEFEGPEFGSEQEKKDYLQKHYLPFGIIVGESKDSAHERSPFTSDLFSSARGMARDLTAYKYASVVTRNGEPVWTRP
jgi:hypothetical protein